MYFFGYRCLYYETRGVYIKRAMMPARHVITRQIYSREAVEGSVGRSLAARVPYHRERELI